MKLLSPEQDTGTLRVSSDRLLDRLEQLAAIGRTFEGACCRLALSDEDRTGRDQVVAWMREARPGSGPAPRSGERSLCLLNASLRSEAR